MSALDERTQARDLRSAVRAHVAAHGPCALGACVTALAKPLPEVRAAMLDLIASGDLERAITTAEGVQYRVAARGRQRGAA